MSRCYHRALRDRPQGLGQPLKDSHSGIPSVLAWQLRRGPRPPQYILPVGDPALLLSAQLSKTFPAKSDSCCNQNHLELTLLFQILRGEADGCGEIPSPCQWAVTEAPGSLKSPIDFLLPPWFSLPFSTLSSQSYGPNVSVPRHASRKSVMNSSSLCACPFLSAFNHICF